MRSISLAHLTLLHVPPPELVRIAADVGYDSVGLRIAPVKGRVDHAMLGPSSPARRATVQALADTGVRVLDAEVIRLRPDEPIGTHVPILAAAGDLGAAYVIVTVEDPDRARATASFAELCTTAHAYGVSCVLEFMIFSAVRTLADAREVVEGAAQPGAAVLLDPLHLFRGGGTVEMVAALPPALVPYVQLCDAPDAKPARDEVTARAEAVAHRLLPGAGALPLTEFVAAAPPEAAISVEVPHPDAGSVDSVEYARASMAAARSVLGADHDG